MITLTIQDKAYTKYDYIAMPEWEAYSLQKGIASSLDRYKQNDKVLEAAILKELNKAVLKLLDEAIKKHFDS